MSRLRKLVFCASFFCAIMMAAAPQAARDFARLTFAFDSPQQMKVAAQGATLVLQFSAPVSESREAILQKAGPRAKEVSVSKDGKKVTITLDAAYRTRQFRSNNRLGIDILTGDVAEEAPAAGNTPPPVPTPVIEPSPKPASKPETSPILSTKTAAQPAATSSILSTKKAVVTPPPAPEPPVSPVATEPPVVPAAPESPPVATPSESEPKPASAVAKPTPEESVAAVESPPVAEPASPGAPFMVTTKETEAGIWLNFPWEERVAAATLTRAGDIWIVFSKPVTVQTELLKPLLPKSVINFEQFVSPSHTVLRLTTDGSLHVLARQPKGSYRWHMLISTRNAPPTSDITVSTQNDDGENSYLLFALFGSGKPLSFYDPRVGDRVFMVPTHEESHGFGEARRFPAIEIPQTQQGLSITTLRDDLTLSYSRSGLKLAGKESLALSRQLPTLTNEAEPVRTAKISGTVAMPYDQWYVPIKDYLDTQTERLRNVANATPAARPDAILSLAQLALAHGFMAEALGHLNLLKEQYPNFYAANQLALLRAATNLFMNRVKEAEADIASPELELNEELQLWRDAIGLFTPAIVTRAAPTAEDIAEQKTVLSAVDADITNDSGSTQPFVTPAAKPFDFIGYNKGYIRFYPPAVRQKLALLAADFYFQANEPEQAVAIFDTLNKDNIMQPVQAFAELALAKTAAKKSELKEAEGLLDRLKTQQEDRYVQAQARYVDAITKYRNNLLPGPEAIEELERIRMGWRGDAFERRILRDLADMYSENKMYDGTLRTLKYTLNAFPSDPDALTIATNMSDLFKKLFLGGEADAMEPLKALALFYEFRELTPIGVEGDEMIQHLADRLAAVDLLDRAAQLLDHQIRYRASGESRARIGARLAIISLLNQEPARALEVLQVTNYGAAPAELKRQRQQLMAQALSRMGKHEDALVMLYSDPTREGSLLRLDILWAMQDWANIINQAEDLLTARPNLTDPLTAEETTVLLKLALAYNFEGDYTQLGYLRDYYLTLVPESPIKEILNFLTNDTTPIDASDSQVVAKQISNTEGFLDLFRKKIAEGKLSEIAEVVPEVAAPSIPSSPAAAAPASPSPGNVAPEAPPAANETAPTTEASTPPPATPPAAAAPASTPAAPSSPETATSAPAAETPSATSPTATQPSAAQ